MKIRVFKDYDELSKATARIIADQVKKKPDTVFCLPGGSSPIGMYEELVNMYKRGEVDFKDMIAFDMDAYISLGPDHKNSYAYFNDIHFLNHVNVKKTNRFMPNVFAEDLKEEAARYGKKIEEFGGIDISVTGVGDNGHICFVEPGSYLLPKYHIADLHPKTIEANSRFFNDISEVPKQSFTLGLEEIMKCKTFLVIASGKKKAPIFAKMFENDHIYPEYPITFLRMHPNCIFLLDEDAASGIPEKELKKFIEIEQK